MNKLFMTITIITILHGNILIAMKKDDWHTRQNEQQKQQDAYYQNQRNFAAGAAVLSAQINNTPVQVPLNVSPAIANAAHQQNIHAMLFGNKK